MQKRDKTAPFFFFSDGDSCKAETLQEDRKTIIFFQKKEEHIHTSFCNSPIQENLKKEMA